MHPLGQVVSKRRTMMVNMSRGIEMELISELKRDAVTFPGAIGRGFYSAVEHDFLQSSPEWFNDNKNLGSAMARILLVKTQAMEVAKLLMVSASKVVSVSESSTPRRFASDLLDGTRDKGSEAFSVKAEVATELEVDGNLGSTGAAILTEWLRDHTVIRHLGLQRCAIADEGMRHICKVVCEHASLTSLDLCKSGVGDRGMDLLAGALNQSPTPRLTCVKLDSWQLVPGQAALTLKKLPTAGSAGRALLWAVLRANHEVQTLVVGWMRLEQGLAGKLLREPIVDLNGRRELQSATLLLAQVVSGSITLTDLSLSNIRIGAKGAKPIAEAILVSKSLTSINLGRNELCGLDDHGDGTYTAEGIIAISSAISVSKSLTEI